MSILTEMSSRDTDDCVDWPYGRSNGYGRIRGTLTHIAVCEQTHGPRPDGMEAAHHCGNPLCVNARHIRWATPLENIADKVAHGTQGRGETVATAKLTEQKVRSIRRRCAEGEAHTELAREFGVSHTAIHLIHTRQTWRHVA